MAAAREAVDIRRALAAQRPDAFRPNLANSLAVLANCLDATGQQEEALAASVAAITTLTDPFQRHPRAFAPQMLQMTHDYQRRCEAMQRQPNEHLLAPIVHGFAELQAAVAGGGGIAASGSS